MLKVKNLTLFKQKKLKRREFLPRLLCSIFFTTYCRVLAWFEPNFCSLSNASNFRALALILFDLWPFSPHNLWKGDFFFRQSDPPPQEESKCKNAQFLHWILKDDDVYFQKKKKSQHLKFEGIIS